MAVNHKNLMECTTNIVCVKYRDSSAKLCGALTYHWASNGECITTAGRKAAALISTAVRFSAVLKTD